MSSEIRAYCPFHDDGEPSFSFNTETGLWYCFACRIGGNAVDFLMRLKGVSRETALEEIKDYTLPVAEDDIENWCKCLWQSPSALGYLAGRGLLDESVIKKYRIGYDGSRITIPVYSTTGDLVNVRKLAIDGRRKNKVINLPGTELYLWPIQSLIEGNGQVYICEGETDCLTALVQGLRAVTGTGGAGSWCQEWSGFFKDCDVVVAYDNDPAGRDGTSLVLTSLKDYAKSLATLDIPEGDDLNSLHQKGVRITDIAVKPVTAAESDDITAVISELKKLSQDTDAKHRFELLRKLAKLIADKPPLEQEHYLELARKTLHIPKDALRKAVKNFGTEATATSMPTPLKKPRATNICLPQYYDYDNKVFWYGVWLPTDSEGLGEYVFRLVTSEQRFEEFPNEDLIPPQDEITARWSVDTATPYNVFDWVTGRTDPIDPKQLFYEIREVFERFMWYPDENIYSVLACWIMMTYVFMVFDTTAYLTLTGTKRAGKSRTLELIEALAFNAVKAGTMSASQIFRAVELNRHTLLFDESDVLSASAAATQSGVDERLSIVLEGYKHAGKAGRIEGDRLMPKWYRTYSPKAFASMHNLPDTVVDRAIAIKILRKSATQDVENLVFAEEAIRFQILRNKLYCFGLENASKLAEIRRNVIELLKDHGIKDRELELWHSVVAVACLAGIDYNCLLEYAQSSAVEKTADEQENSFTTAVIQACYRLLKEDTPDEVSADGSWYLRTRLKDVVADIMDYDTNKISTQRIRSELVKTGIIDTSQTFSKQLGRGRLRGKRAYRLDHDRVMDAVVRYDVSVGPGSEFL